MANQMATPKPVTDSPKAEPALTPGAKATPAPTPTAQPTPNLPKASSDAVEFEEQLMTALRAIWRELREVKELLRAQAQTQPGPAEARAPNLRRLLSEYPTFDWETIGAKVLSADEDGATTVIWGGHTYMRRTNPKFGAEIWFSRSIGRGEDGEIGYERLITFAKAPEVEPLPQAVRRQLSQAT